MSHGVCVCVYSNDCPFGYPTRRSATLQDAPDLAVLPPRASAFEDAATRSMVHWDWLHVDNALTRRTAAVVVATAAAQRSEHATEAAAEVVAARDTNGDAHGGNAGGRASGYLRGCSAVCASCCFLTFVQPLDSS